MEPEERVGGGKDGDISQQSAIQPTCNVWEAIKNREQCWHCGIPGYVILLYISIK